jgi:hypothetical protein
MSKKMRFAPAALSLSINWPSYRRGQGQLPYWRSEGSSILTTTSWPLA